MKRVYKVGAHKVKLVIKKFLGPRLCGQSLWESKTIEVRPTNVDDGTPYTLSGFLSVFFHEFFHAIDSKQGTELFGDANGGAEDQVGETLLNSFCEGFIEFMLDNRLLNDKWLDGCRDLLSKTKPFKEEKNGEEDGEEGSN